MITRMSLCFLLLWRLAAAQMRLCEADGSCRHCADNRFSYYRCRQQDDCFIGETCDDGFCCPNPQPNYSLQREQARKASTNASIPSNDPCPDGSLWERRCSRDEDCTHREEVCAEGKCCKICSVKRRALLDELRTIEIVGQAIPLCDENGVFYRKRQCMAGTEICWCVTKLGRRLSRKEYRNVQECETVRRRQENLARKAAALIHESFAGGKICTAEHVGDCPRLQNATSSVVASSLLACDCDTDCVVGKKCCRVAENRRVCLPTTRLPTQPATPSNSTSTVTPIFVPTTNPLIGINPLLPSTLSLACGANEQYTACYSACQPSCEDPTTIPCPAPSCPPGCHCLPGFIRRDGSPKSMCVPRALCSSYDSTMRCADDRRQYQTCGSACPVSCETRNTPRCSERCVTGCFCRIPFILENGNDPLHSRCILPSECSFPNTPPPPIGGSIPFTARNAPVGPGFVSLPGVYVTTPEMTTASTRMMPTLIPDSHHCSDPLKNYHNCGSACPSSCDRRSPSSLECALSCVPGCFCRLPYVLADSTEPQSPCILPQLCPRSPFPTPVTTLTPTIVSDVCQEPRKEWTTCGANQCARSCQNPLGRCSAGECSHGCVCREPYVLQDAKDSMSRCVLPSECEQKCDDPAKEYIPCGSSCPMGCDNRHPKNCAPCQAGCYCRNGMVFLTSSTWHSSRCVRLEDCPAESSPEPMAETTTAEVVQTLPTIFSHTELEMINQTELLAGKSQQCPTTTFDVGGRSCDADTDCPMEQRCCRPVIVSLGVNPQRCVCPDPRAVWSACGSLCPEYCGQPTVPVCSSTCSAGCHCAPGFIRSRNDVAAPCVPREHCSRFSKSHDDVVREPFPRATIQEIPPSNPFRETVYQVAVAVLVARDSSMMGRFTFAEISSTTTKIRGEVFGLPSGPHAVVLHQFGDTSDGCSRIGPPYSQTSLRTPSLGDVGENGIFDRVVDWPVSEVVGRSVVVYRFSTVEWAERVQTEKPLACGTIGLTKLSAS